MRMVKSIAPALLDQLLIQVHPIGQDHIPNGARVLVLAVRLKGDFLRLRLHRHHLWGRVREWVRDRRGKLLVHLVCFVHLVGLIYTNKTNQ